MAISKAAEEGAKAVICASTGNTSASAAAYAVRAGMVCAVLVPAGQDRARQAGAGARPRRAAAPGRGQLRRLPDARPRARRALPGRAGQLASTRAASRARRPRRSRSSTLLGDAPDIHCSRSATPATSPRTGRATASTPPTAPPRARPRMWGFQAAGAAPIVSGEPVAQPVDDRHRDPDRQPGVVGSPRSRRATSRAA